MRSLLFIVLATAACGAPIQHQHGTFVQEPDSSAANAPEEMTCSNHADTGTLLAHSECHPVQRDKDSRDDMVRDMTKTASGQHATSNK